MKHYGVVAVSEPEGNVFPVTGMVEKPAPGTEPSNLTILGRYILQPEIFGLLAEQEKGGEYGNNGLQIGDDARSQRPNSRQRVPETYFSNAGSSPERGVSVTAWFGVSNTGHKKAR